MDLFKLVGKVVIDNSGANKNIDDTTSKAEGSESKISSVFGKIGKGAMVAAVVAATATTAIATGLAAITKQSITAYADYEQLAGGVAKLYGSANMSLDDYAKSVGKSTSEVKDKWNDLQKSQKIVMDNAAQAYKTAGMSANEYMDTATQFSASLISSLKGDTIAAANQTDVAMRAMSDNVNTFGSNAEDVSNAFKGFSKQNYTMLDNLKLGYGGTKEEMQRLIKDANEWGKANHQASNLSIDSFSDVVTAIQQVQEKQGIAGTTSREAATTISGSIGMMKSAWQNFLAGMADPSQDFNTLLGNVVDSVVQVANNIIPRLTETIPRLVSGLVGIANTLATYMPEILNSLLPALFCGAAQLLSTLVAGIPALFQTLVPTMIDAVKSILSDAVGASGIGNALNRVFSDGFISSMQKWSPYLADMTVMFGQDTIDLFSSKVGSLMNMFSALGAVLQPVVETMLNDLVVGFDALITVLDGIVLPIIRLVIDVFVSLVTTIATAITPAIQSLSTSFQSFQQIVSAIIEDAIVPAIQSFIQMLQELFAENQDKLSKIGELYSIVFNNIAAIVAVFVDVCKNTIYPFMLWLSDFIQEHMGLIKAIYQSAFNVLGGILDFFIALFKGDWSGMWEAVKTILSAGFSYVQNVFNLMKAFISSIGSAIWSVVQNAFENVRMAIVNKLNQAKASVISIFEAIRSSINEKMEAAKNIVSAAVQKLKDFFNFDWSLPKIKLPHFSISGSFSLDPPSTPSFGIDWYKNGGIMLKPTAFGINPATGNTMVGGEAGAEAIAPIGTLKQYVSEAVASQNAELISVLNLILAAVSALDEGLAEKLYNALLGLKFQVSEREFARLVKAVN